MAKHDFIVDKKHIDAIKNFTCKDYSRPIICALHVKSKDGFISYDATDCYIAASMTQPTECGEFELCIDMADLLSVKADKNGYIIEFDDEEPTLVQVTTMQKNRASTTTFNTVEGQYPDIDKVLCGEHASDGVALVNPAFFERVFKAFRIVAKGVRFSIHSAKPSVFQYADGNGFVFKACAMPQKYDGNDHNFRALYGAQEVGEVSKDELNTLRKAHEEMVRAYGDSQDKVRELEERINDIVEHYEQVCDGRAQRIDELTKALKEADNERQVHEWESKTLRWFDHEVEGARQCKKKGSKNFGMWFIPKVATA